MKKNSSVLKTQLLKGKLHSFVSQIEYFLKIIKEKIKVGARVISFAWLLTAVKRKQEMFVKQLCPNPCKPLQDNELL